MAVGGYACAVDAVLFDKDGTLIEFDPLWCGWARTVIERLAERARLTPDRLAEAIGLDIGREAHLPDGPLAAGTMRDLATVLAHQLYAHAGLPWGAARDVVREAMHEAEPALGERAEIRPLPGAVELVRRLGEVGVVAAVVTSDDTPRATHHLKAAGLEGHVSAVVGADRVSDGGKPGPEGVLLACHDLGVSPTRTAMIGDSEGDTRAAIAAGLAASFHLDPSGGAPPGAHPLVDHHQIELTPE
jgi:phosphoglycolate phosphatase